VAQPTIRDAATAAAIRLRHLGICNIAPSIAAQVAKGKQLFTKIP